jgi:transposase
MRAEVPDRRGRLDWRRKVELFEEIRREYEFGIGTIAGVAKKLGVHRRMVREAVAHALPAKRKLTVRRAWKIDPAKEFIDAILEADRKAPRKQRHTAHRIWQRIHQERPDWAIAERTIRQYVERRKRKLGMDGRDIFIPQSYGWGAEGQVDWYEAWADVAGERQKQYVFCMRSMASGAAFHRAFPRATQQAFLEAHEHAFAYFGGVFRKLRYDNLSSAVRKIVRGQRREETARFIAFRSHWRFQAEFCTPGEAHEKGGVEGESGYFRRNHWVPVPVASDLDDLNEQLRAACQDDEHRVIAGREQSIGAAILIERDHLLPLPAERFDLAEIAFPTVDGHRCVRVRTNRYSVPAPPGITVEAKIYASFIEIWRGGERIARHERCYHRLQQILDLEHYLDVLHRKPGALAGSKPLEQQRQAGLWPVCFDTFWSGLTERYGKQNGTKQMIELLTLGKEHSQVKLQQAVECCLSLDCWDVAAVRHFLHAETWRRPPCEAIDIGPLSRYERPLPVMNSYDELLAGGMR